MCAVSRVGDHYRDKFDKEWPRIKPWEYPREYPIPVVPNFPDINPLDPPFIPNIPQISKEEFETLKKEVQEMKKLLKKAIKYDQENNQPDCQMDDKIELLRKIAKLVGIPLDDIFTKDNKVVKNKLLQE